MKLFLSHSSRDSQLTNKIYDWLQSQSYVDEIWIDRIKLKTGDYLLNKLDEGITTSNYLIPVLTKNSINSSWVKYEIKKALSEETKKNIKVLPVIKKDTRIPRFLKNKIYITIDDKLSNLDDLYSGFLPDHYIFEIHLDQNFEVNENSLITNIRNFFRETDPCYVKIYSNDYNEKITYYIKKRLRKIEPTLGDIKNELTKLYLFKNQLQLLFSNLSFLLSKLIQAIIDELGKETYTIEIITESIKNIFKHIHSYLVSEISELIYYHSKIEDNERISKYFNQHIEYIFPSDIHREIALINKIHYQNSKIPIDDFTIIRFVSKPNISMPTNTNIKLARFDFFEEIKPQINYYNIEDVISKKNWFTKCIPQIVSWFLYYITFREDKRCKDYKNKYIGFSQNDYEYFGIP